jgi:hypothetical protein
MQDLIAQLLAAHPALAVVITVLTVLRAVLKPLMTMLEAGVTATGNQKAKDILNQVETSKLYNALSFVLDYTASFKLPVVQAAMAGKVTAGSSDSQPAQTK